MSEQKSVEKANHGRFYVGCTIQQDIRSVLLDKCTSLREIVIHRFPNLASKISVQHADLLHITLVPPQQLSLEQQNSWMYEIRQAANHFNQSLSTFQIPPVSHLALKMNEDQKTVRTLQLQLQENDLVIPIRKLLYPKLLDTEYKMDASMSSRLSVSGHMTLLHFEGVNEQETSDIFKSWQVSSQSLTSDVLDIGKTIPTVNLTHLVLFHSTADKEGNKIYLQVGQVDVEQIFKHRNSETQNSAKIDATKPTPN